MIYVHPSGPGRVRMWVRDCNDALITSDVVASITYTVWNISASGKRTSAVTGHSDVSVPLENLMSETLQDEDEDLPYNFECLLSAQVNKPFPENNKNYEIEFIFTDTAGEPHPKSVLVRTKTI